MFTLPEGARTQSRTWAVWESCQRCGQQFAPVPGQRFCHACGGAGAGRVEGRCGMAHPDDWSACDGPVDAVMVVDRTGNSRPGCVHHAAVALASIKDARVLPGSDSDAAVVAFTRAQALPPFAFNQSSAGGGQ